ncbi:MAG: hypothetical protein L6406_11255 [Desulfobacterales bacterium]|nr:hypothetical protein [Desulfobacterales bacterium]
MKCVLAYDLGGTSIRAVLMNTEGEWIVQHAVQQPPPVIDNIGRSEKNPDEWWRDFIRVTGLILGSSEAAEAEIAGLVISGLTRTQIFLDRSGRVIRPAITWADGRAVKQADQIVSVQSRIGPRGLTFGPVNPFHTLARLLWIKDYEQNNFERINVVLEPKDYINFRLTGELAGDLISLSRLLSTEDMGLAVELFDQLGLPVEIVPRLAEPQDCLGSVLPNLEEPLDRLAGVPVFVGGMDSWCASLGIGANRSGCAFNISGTSEVFGMVTESRTEAPGLVTLPWGRDLYQIGGPSQAGGDCLAWYLDAFEGGADASSVAGLLDTLTGLERQPEPIIFLPYLQGERTPLWNSDVRGIFLGINRRHSRADFIWSILEGVAMANRQVFDLATAENVNAVKEVRISGGAASSEIWCQIKADVLNLLVVRTNVREAGLLGAAMVALVGLGEFSSIAECQNAMVHTERAFEPRPEQAEAYNQIYRRWLDTQNALLPVSCALTRDVREGLTVRL